MALKLKSLLTTLSNAGVQQCRMQSISTLEILLFSRVHSPQLTVYAALPMVTLIKTDSQHVRTPTGRPSARPHLVSVDGSVLSASSAQPDAAKQYVTRDNETAMELGAKPVRRSLPSPACPFAIETPSCGHYMNHTSFQ